MATTNFSLLQSNEKLVWQQDVWRAARNQSFLNQFMGDDANSMIQRVTSLKQTEKGTRAVITLVHDFEGDGVAGDRQLEGNEEQMASNDVTIRVDQLRNAAGNEGKLADQKSVVTFRENAKNNLSYWLADRSDQMGFLTLAGIAYSKKPNGGTRAAGSALPQLEFAADVTAPTANRAIRWNGTTKKIVYGSGNTTAAVSAGDTLSWSALVQMRAFAKDTYMRGVRGKAGDEVYHVFVSPQAMAQLKLDADYMANVRYAQERGSDNALFSGAAVKVDGLMIHEFRHVPHTLGAASGSKFGGSGTLDGHYVIMAGAQAMGYADIGDAEWNEKEFDYGNRQGIETGKIFGMKKPTFRSIYTGSVEDFGVLVGYFSFS